METFLYLYCTRCLDSWTCQEESVQAAGSKCQVCKCGGGAAILARGDSAAAAREAGAAQLQALKAAAAHPGD